MMRTLVSVRAYARLHMGKETNDQSHCLIGTLVIAVIVVVGGVAVAVVVALVVMSWWQW